MNQGKLEMVKQEMARVNIDILGISELKWIGMGEVKSDDTNVSLNTDSEVQFSGKILKTTQYSRFVSKANHSVSQ